MKVTFSYLDDTWIYKSPNGRYLHDFFNTYWDLDYDAPAMYMCISDNALQLAIL